MERERWIHQQGLVQLIHYLVVLPLKLRRAAEVYFLSQQLAYVKWNSQFRNKVALKKVCVLKDFLAALKHLRFELCLFFKLPLKLLVCLFVLLRLALVGFGVLHDR